MAELSENLYLKIGDSVRVYYLRGRPRVYEFILFWLVKIIFFIQYDLDLFII